MLDVDTFLTTLYVMVDDFCQSRPRKVRRPGPDASLSDSEVVTLAVFARFSRFASERDFHRYAESNLRSAFPTLPDRSQFNRHVRSLARLLEEVALHLAELMGARECPYEALDSAAMVASGTPSAEARGGSRATPTSDGPTDWDGTRASGCWSP
jgi:hypothetical protein